MNRAKTHLKKDATWKYMARFGGYKVCRKRVEVGRRVEERVRKRK